MRPFLWIATIVAVLCVLPAVNPAPVHAEPPLVYPGMLIYQGSLSCTLGYVDPALRVGITAGHCFNGDGIIRNGDGTAVGHKVLAHDNRPPRGRYTRTSTPSTTRPSRSTTDCPSTMSWPMANGSNAMTR